VQTVELSSLQDLAARMQNSGALEIRNTLVLISGGRVLDVSTSRGDFIVMSNIRNRLGT